MKTGKSIVELAQEIERQRTTKKDFVADTSVMHMTPEGALTLGDRWRSDGVSDLAHEQIADHTRIPQAYYKRMRTEAPELLATNVDAWFAKYPAPRMVRALDGRVRAFLSNSYRPLENADLAEAILRAGVLVQPLSWHRQRPGTPGFVLGYAAHTPDRLHEAARRIGQALCYQAGR